MTFYRTPAAPPPTHTHDCLYRDTRLQEHAGTGLLASKNACGGYTEEKKFKRLKLMWIATIRKAAAHQAVFALWLKCCFENSVLQIQTNNPK